MGKPLATIAMADQHRATPEQWRRVTRWAKEDKSGTDSCILELRARIEALEAAQREAPMDELRAASAEARPAGGLVLRVSETNNSRDAICAVAAWLRSEYPRREGFGTAWANLIEQEADRG